MIQQLFTPILLSALLLSTAEAAVSTPPRLMQTINGEQPIQLQKLNIHSEITGGLAETTVEMVFFNPNRRPLEGNLQFPLADGQQISGFALDINGQLRPAVPVDKAKGKQVFEEISRRRVDPALLEQTQGNNFKLRVYPINSHSTRTVQIKYVESLSRQGADWSYRLPLAYGEVNDFGVTVDVDGTEAAPVATALGGKMTFDKRGNHYLAHLDVNNVNSPNRTLQGEIKLQIPAAKAAQTYIESEQGENFFLTEIPVPDTQTPRILPRVVGLLWDSSGSGANRDHEAELAVLDGYFKTLKYGEVRLTRLRDHAETVEIYHVVNGNWRALRTALQNTVYDGASALADWQAQADVGEYLLVSDGLGNYGSRPFPTLGSKQRLYALNAASSSDSSRLAAMAERNHGEFIRIDADHPEQALRNLLNDGVRITRMEGQGIADVHLDPNGQQQGLLRVAGHFSGTQTELQITLNNAGKEQTITLPIGTNSPHSPIAAQLWANYHVHALEADYELKRGEIRRIGQRFAIPTRETSLIVLDSMADYVRYNITPPAAYRKEFEQLKADRAAIKQRQTQDHLDRIVSEFNEKLRWWERFYPKGPRYTKREKMAEEMDRQTNAAAPAASMAEPEMMADSSVSERRRSQPAPAPIAMAKKSAGSSNKGGNEIGISLKKWTSDAPYISRMQAASADNIYAIYLDEKPDYRNSSAFFLDAADMLLEKKQRALALRVLSNLTEMDLENPQILRILGYRLLQVGEPQLAIPIFEKVQRLAPEEPQSFRDLGLAFAAAKRYQSAINQLNEVVQNPWDDRFAEIELIALAELNAIIAQSPTPLDTRKVDPRLLKNMPLDLRAVLSWDADNSDMDLWVTDPNGEKCYYGNRFTYQGGRLSRDFTGGYGPEEFSLRYAKPGTYRIEANFFGNRQQTVAGATTLQLTLTTSFGTNKAKDQHVTLRLKEHSESVFVGEFTVKP